MLSVTYVWFRTKMQDHYFQWLFPWIILLFSYEAWNISLCLLSGVPKILPAHSCESKYFIQGCIFRSGFWDFFFLTPSLPQSSKKWVAKTILLTTLPKSLSYQMLPLVSSFPAPELNPWLFSSPPQQSCPLACLAAHFAISVPLTAPGCPHVLTWPTRIFSLG